jgi:hypothetical protein
MKLIKNRTKNLIHHFTISNSGKYAKDTYHLDYENEIYRQEALSKLIRDTVIYFALTPAELATLDSETLAKLQSRAWNRISNRPKEKKGDYGELLLFLILETFYPARKFVTKIKLRSSLGDEIKGYDCAHFSIEENGEICLWLGEAKFHQNFSGAIAKAVKSVNDHLNIKSLKNELSILEGNIDIGGEEGEKLEDYLNSGISLDAMKFKVPVLLTYDSACIPKHTSICDQFKEELGIELDKRYVTIENQTIKIPANVELHFIVLPFETVESMKESLEKIEKAYK